MTYQIELHHPELCEYKLFIDNKLHSEGSCERNIVLSVPSMQNISIWFSPWKILPLIRVNNFLVNTGLANIDVFDHKFDMVLDDGFFDMYHKNDIASREQSFFLNQNGKVDEILYDKVIGTSQHQDLVDKITQVLGVE